MKEIIKEAEVPVGCGAWLHSIDVTQFGCLRVINDPAPPKEECTFRLFYEKHNRGFCGVVFARCVLHGSNDGDIRVVLGCLHG